MSDRHKLLKKVGEAEFAMIDVILYLDTHPTDNKALEFYNKYRNNLEMVTKQYTQKYGPLTNKDVKSGDRFSWIDNPWPWEVEQ